MGYTTEFTGMLGFKADPTNKMLRKLINLFGVDSRRRNDAPKAEWLYNCFEITAGLDGIEWDGGEKFYGAVDAVNWMTKIMREEYPDFSFKGEMLAQGEDVEDLWRLVVDEKGIAKKIEVVLSGNTVVCPECGKSFIYNGEK